MTVINQEDVMRAVTESAPELGAFTTALQILETAARLGSPSPAELKSSLRSRFPMCLELLRTGQSADQLRDRVNVNVRECLPVLEQYKDIVVVGIEAIILDVLVNQLPNTIAFHVIPHDESCDVDRFLSNYPPNVQCIDVRRILSFGRTSSVLLSYLFCLSHTSGFVYPIVSRAIGPDVRMYYGRLVGLRILEGYEMYPDDLFLVEGLEYFTDINHIAI